MRTDLVVARRTLQKTPGLSLVALVSLAVAIGVATAAFTVVQIPAREGLWIPGQMNANAANASTESLTLFGRLRAGALRAQAAAELTVLSASATPTSAADRTTSIVMPFTRGALPCASSPTLSA